MNTNYDVIFNLINLLVKKAGFDINKNYSEEELKKTNNSLKKLNNKKNEEKSEELNDTITNLKLRQANWQNNAEIVGKSLLDAYKENKSYTLVKMRIDLLANLANKGTEKLNVGYLYSKIQELENDYNLLNKKIKNNKYINNNEKEIDIKYRDYLDNKVKSLSYEFDLLIKELDDLRDVENKDVNIVNKIKEYITNLEYDKMRLEKVLKNNINTDISLEVLEKIENAKSEIESKLSKNNEMLSKTEEMLDGVREKRKILNNRKDNISIEKVRCSNKLKIIINKLEVDSYENKTEKIIDINSLEKIKMELEELKNKKDVLYIDANKVKEELINEWSNIKEESKETRKKVIKVLVEKKSKEEIEVEKNEKVQDKIEKKSKENMVIKKEKVVFDW